MGYSISTTVAILFLATMLAIGGLHAAGGNAAERVVDATSASFGDHRDLQRVDVEIAEATYYAPDDRLVVDVTNVGAVPLSPSRTDVLVDDALVASFDVRRVGGRTDSDVWAIGETLHLEIVLDDPRRLKVVTEHGLARATGLEPYSLASIEWPTFSHDPGNTGHIDTTRVGTNPTEAWRYRTGGPVISSPAVFGDALYVGGDDGSVRAIDASGGDVLWEVAPDGSAIRSSPAVADGIVYVGTDAGNVLALHAENGSVVWNVSTPGGPVRSSPTVANDTVYVGSDDGSVYALDAQSGGSQSGWPFATGDAVRTTPAVAEGTIYLGSDDGSVYAVHAENGTERWSTTLDLLRQVRSDPAVVGGTVYVGAIDVLDAGDVVGSMYALDAADGTQQWSEPVQTRASPAVNGSTVFVADDNGTVTARHASNGSLRWAFDMGNATESAPAVTRGVVYAADEGGVVYAIDVSSGTERWRVPVGTAVRSSPAVVDGALFVGDDDGDVTAVVGS